MNDTLRSRLLRLLRVPPEPHPPAGAPGSVRVFRAAPNYFKLRLVGWGVGQVLALAGLVVSLAVMWRVGEEVPDRVQWLILAAEVFGVVSFLVQLPVTFAMLRLDYEQRWYVVTDRSLRIRSGVWRVWELTMSFANLQQVVVTQGPLQRWLGLADVRVESAGGGGSPAGQPGQTHSLHTGFFHGVDNAAEIRDLIAERLRQFRQTGLGDPDEKSAPEKAAPCTRGAEDELAAARELLAEARNLRATLAGSPR